MHKILLQQIPNLWRAESITTAASTAVSTGFAELDQALGGGWPMPGLVELLCDQWGIGELQLVVPLIASLSAPSTAKSALKPMLWINPPYELQAASLAQMGLEPAQQWLTMGLNATDALWTVEQALRSGACGAVLAWLSEVTMASLRRLKLAALSATSVAVLFRPTRAATQTSAANLRLLLSAHALGLQVQLLKVPGRKPSTVLLPLAARAGWLMNKTVP